MRKFKLASLLLTIILLTNISFAQTCDSTCCEQPKSQIQFHLVNDYSVSYLKMLTPNSGLRFKMDLGLRGSTEDNEERNKNHFLENQLPQSSLYEQTIESNYSSQYVNLVFNYVLQYKLEDELSCFLGAGPLLSYSHSNSGSTTEQKNINPNINNVSVSKTNDTNSFWGVGVQIAIGAEVNIGRKLSLLAEFNLNGTYSWNKHTHTWEYPTDSYHWSESSENGTAWNYGLNQLKLGIAYRF